MTNRDTFNASYAVPSDRMPNRPLLESLEPRLLFSATLTADAGPDLTADEGSAITVEGSFLDTDTGTPGTFDLLTLPSSSAVRTDFTAHSISGDNVIWYDTGGNVYVFDGTTDGAGNPNVVDLTDLTGGSISTSGYSVDADGDRVAFNSASKGVYVYTVSTGVVQQVGSSGSSISNVQINGDNVTWQKSSSSFLKTFIYDLSDPLATEQLLVESTELGGAGNTTEAMISDGIAYWIGAGGAGGFTDVFAKDLTSGIIFNVSNTSTHGDQNISADAGVVGWNSQTPVPFAYVFDGRGFDGTGTVPAPVLLEGFAGASTVRPSVSGSNVAFESAISSRNRDIFVYNVDTATTTNITNDGSVNSEQFAFIQGSSLVWENTVGATSDVVLYDLDTAAGTSINTDGVRDYKPLLSGANVSYVSGGSVVFARGQGNATYQFDWDFGDGTVLTDASLSESHTYADDGVYTATLTVTSSNGEIATDTATITVSNAAPELTGLVLDTTSVDEGGAVTLAGSFIDAGTLDTHTVSVTWGDGSTSSAVVNQVAGTFEATHTYLDDTPTGTASDIAVIGVTLIDDDAGSDSGNESVVVNNLAPVVTAVSGPDQAVRGQTLSYIGSFTDAGTLDTHAEAWTVVDNSSGGVVATGTGPSFEFEPDSIGSFTVTYTVTDDDTGTGDSSATVSTSLTLVTADPIDPSQSTLLIGGSDNSELIKVFGRSDGLKVKTYDFATGELNIESGIQADRIIVYGNGGNDSIKVFHSAGDKPAELFGGEGNDWIRGGKGDDVIVGGSGNDFIGGYNGRDLLIGGDGTDFVIGHRQDDILVSGSYTGQNDLASLRAIMALWTGTNSYTDRVASLSPLLNDTTVSDDDNFDLLLGLQGQDYFLYNDNQDLTDQRRNELMTDTEIDFLDSEVEEA